MRIKYHAYMSPKEPVCEHDCSMFAPNERMIERSDKRVNCSTCLSILMRAGRKRKTVERNKNVFPALFFVIIVMMICCLGCAALNPFHEDPPTIGQELCAVGCANVGGEYHWQKDHTCYCKFAMPHFKIQDTSSPKQDTQQKQDKPSIGGTMVLR